MINIILNLTYDNKGTRPHSKANCYRIMLNYTPAINQSIVHYIISEASSLIQYIKEYDFVAMSI